MLWVLKVTAHSFSFSPFPSKNDFSYCQTNGPLCEHGGTCSNTGNFQYSCACAPQWYGTVCQTFNICVGNPPCVNSVSCTPTGNNTATCACLEGYSGPTCAITPCNSNPCLFGSSCVNGYSSGAGYYNTTGNYSCLCLEGYSGTDCSVTPCSSSPCLNNAQCENGYSASAGYYNSTANYSCACLTGYSGPDCGTTPCETIACTDFGVCLNGNVPGANSFYNSTTNSTCSCLTGYSGDLCQVTPCDVTTCANSGSCINGQASGPNDYYNATANATCSCVPPWSMEGCAWNNPCLLSPCDHGVCNNTGDGLYFCNCSSSEWYGQNCSVFNVCVADNPCVNGVCQSTGNSSYFCNCAGGDSGQQCQCTPTSCLNGGTCVPFNNNGSSTCLCAPGWTNSSCQTEINECYMNNQCGIHGRCIMPAPDQSACLCDCGWSGFYCTDPVDFCSPNNCQNGATCTSLSCGYSCQCAGYWQNANCSYLNNCLGSPCMNAGVCNSTGNGTNTCACVSPWVGPSCAYNDTCLMSPCANGGSCNSTASGEFTCTCPIPWTDPVCAYYDSCLLSPCANNGSCLSTGNASYSCVCQSPWEGSQCLYYDDCDLQPCQNGGTCNSTGNSTHSCLCAYGWSGAQCEVEIDFCLPAPQCANGGVCNPFFGGFNCSCLEQTYGPVCASVNSSFQSYIIDALFQPSNDQLVFTIDTQVAAPFTLASATIGTSVLPGTVYNGYLNDVGCAPNTQQICQQTTSFYFTGLAAYSCVLDTTVTLTWWLACRQSNATLCAIPGGTYPQVLSIFLQASNLCGSTNIDLTLSGSGVHLTGAGLSTYSAGDSFNLTNRFTQGNSIFVSASVSSQVPLASFFCGDVELYIGARVAGLMEHGTPTINWFPPIDFQWVSSPSQFNFTFLPIVGVNPDLTEFLYSDAVGGVISFTIVANCSVGYYEPSGSRRKRGSGNDPISYVTLQQEANFSLTTGNPEINGTCTNTTCANNGTCEQGPSSYVCFCASYWSGPNCTTYIGPTQPPTQAPTSPPTQQGGGESSSYPTPPTSPQPFQPVSDEDVAIVLGASLGSLGVIAFMALLIGWLCRKPPLARRAYMAMRSFAYGGPELLVAAATPTPHAHPGDTTVRRRTARS